MSHKLVNPFTGEEIVNNAFCATGKGGGVNPTCSPGKGSASKSPYAKPFTVQFHDEAAKSFEGGGKEHFATVEEAHEFTKSIPVGKKWRVKELDYIKTLASTITEGKVLAEGKGTKSVSTTVKSSHDVKLPHNPKDAQLPVLRTALAQMGMKLKRKSVYGSNAPTSDRKVAEFEVTDASGKTTVMTADAIRQLAYSKYQK